MRTKDDMDETVKKLEQLVLDKLDEDIHKITIAL